MNARSTAVTLLPWLVCLMLVGLPRSGWAATDMPLRAPTGALSLLEEEPQKETRLTPRPQAERLRAPWGLRLLAEVGAGTVSAVAGGLAGMLVGGTTCLLLGVGRQAPLWCLLAALGTGLLAASEGYALGVWWGGFLTGGEGSLLVTMLSANAALVVSAAGAFVYSNQKRWAFNPVFIIPLPVMLGAHLGYELSQSSPSVQPTVALSPEGATFGLSGRF